MIWVAASRAVRTPSRLDRDLYFYDSSGAPVIVGDDFQSEELLGYRLGCRLQTPAKLSLALSAFYNEYDNLRSLEPGPPPPPNFPYTFRNGVQGHTYGVELATIYQVSERWRLRGGYTFLKKNLSLKPGSNDLNRGTAESDDPAHQFSIQSTADLPGRLEWDAMVRYVDALPDPHVPSYIGLDVRLGWRLTERLELAVVGQNLLDDEHQEFITSSSARRIERGVYGKVAIRW
jgi:iron complex outermembrane receptor protein